MGWDPPGLPDDTHSSATIRVLHVDDQPDFLDLTEAMLARESDAFSVTAAMSVPDAQEKLASASFDCIVSDFDMPGTDGLEFLEAVRDEDDQLPFVLFTGKGSEEIASRAINAGVTDYVQKGGGSEQYEVLANRIRNAVAQVRAQRAQETSRERLSRFIEQSPIGVIEWDADRRIVRLNEAAEDILGYHDGELLGERWEVIVPEHEHEDVTHVSQTLRDDGTASHSVNENVRRDGEVITCEWYNRVVTNGDGETVGVFSQFMDVTEREDYRRRYRTIMQSLPGIVYRSRNEPDWPFVFLDGECEALTGYTRSAILDGDVEWGTDIIVPVDQERIWDTVQAALNANECFEVEYRIETRNGEERRFWERGTGVYDSDGELLALEGFITDATHFDNLDSHPDP